MDGVLIDDDTYRLDTMTKYAFENNLPKLEYPYAYESKNAWDKDTKWDYKQKYFFDYIKDAPIRRYAKEIIQKLHDEGHKIVIITGRYKTKEKSELGDQIRKDTVNWLNKNDISYDKICYADCPKTNEIQENNIDIMIDDSPEILEAATKITKVLCYDNRYNSDLNYENMVRVFSWYDIYREIKKYGETYEK